MTKYIYPEYRITCSACGWTTTVEVWGNRTRPESVIDAWEAAQADGWDGTLAQPTCPDCPACRRSAALRKGPT